MALLSTDDVRGLRAELAGEVVLPDDAAYGEARSIWNGAIDRRPAAVVRCATAEDVAAAIGFAPRHGLEIAVRGGGHNLAGVASCGGGPVVSPSRPRGLAGDAGARPAVLGGGRAPGARGAPPP